MKDFAQRAADGASNRWRDTNYVAVHPFADDEPLLANLDWPKEHCTSVDAYWMVGGDVAFVQVLAALDREPGCYVRWNATTGYTNLVCVIATGVVTQSAFESALEHLSRLGAAERSLQLGEALPLKLTSYEAVFPA